VPKLWTDTIAEHREQVRGSILTSAADLVAESGLLGVTMSAIAERTGIGRATLYKYFPDVAAVLLAWHEQQVGDHLQQLSALARGPGSPGDRLRAVLDGYASMAHAPHGPPDVELSAFLHGGEHLGQARGALHAVLGDVLKDAVRSGEVRDDIPTRELATYTLHALGAAKSAGSAAAVRRLVELTVAGLRPSG